MTANDKPFGRLFIDDDGDLCIEGRENNLIACPACGDADDDWTPLNPDVFPEIVRRWNAFGPTPTPLAAALAVPEVRALVTLLECDPWQYGHGEWQRLRRAALAALKGGE